MHIVFEVSEPQVSLHLINIWPQFSQCVNKIDRDESLDFINHVVKPFKRVTKQTVIQSEQALVQISSHFPSLQADVAQLTLRNDSRQQMIKRNFRAEKKCYMSAIFRAMMHGSLQLLRKGR